MENLYKVLHPCDSRMIEYIDNNIRMFIECPFGCVCKFMALDCVDTVSFGNLLQEVDLCMNMLHVCLHSLYRRWTYLDFQTLVTVLSEFNYEP